MKTATLVKEHPRRRGNLAVSHGPAALYKLSEPLKCMWLDEPFEHVFVSTSTVLGTPETYAFAADETGNCLSWSELDGSTKGDATHAQVLADMGYELLATPPSSEERGGQVP